MVKKLLFLIFLFVSSLSHSATIYVKNGGTGNGTSWDLAYGNLQTALLNANVGDEIWVKQGTYTPSTSQNINDVFVFKNGVKIYGGFDGTETTLLDRADVTGTTTFLSGYLSSTLRSKNIIKIVNVTHADNLIDGFTIQGAQKTIVSSELSGGGVQIHNATIKIKNSIIKDNVINALNYVASTAGSFEGGGAGVYVLNSTVDFENVNVVNNTINNTKNTDAGNAGFVTGAGLRVYGSNFTYNGGRIENNLLNSNGTSSNGAGAFFVLCNNLVLSKLYVYNNTSRATNSLSDPSGAGMNLNFCENLSMNQVIFHGNSSDRFLADSSRQSGRGTALNLSFVSGSLNNCTFGINKHQDYIDIIASEEYQIQVGNSNLQLNNSVFLERFFVSGTGSVIQLNKSVLKFGISNGIPTPNSTFEVATMEFTNPTKGDYRPLHCSRFLNYGTNNLLNATTDIEGNNRIVGTNIDPGAIEAQVSGPVSRLYVNKENTNYLQDGASWETAFSSLSDALNCKCLDVSNNPVYVPEIWVAQGTYVPGYLWHHSFNLNSGQKVYGGFKGDETLLIERDSTLLNNQTILSGKYGENSRVNNVVKAVSTSIETQLDGFIIEDGETTTVMQNTNTNGGAGVFVKGLLTMKNLWIRNNRSQAHFNPGTAFQSNYGAGVLVFRTDGILDSGPAGIIAENVKISNNTVGGTGAGIAFVYFKSINTPHQNPFHSKLKNVQIIDNSATRLDGNLTSGGAIYVYGSYELTFEDFDISNNSSSNTPILDASAVLDVDIKFIRGKFSGNYFNSGLGSVGHIYVGTDKIYSIYNVYFDNVIFERNDMSNVLISTYYKNIHFTNCTIVNNNFVNNSFLAYVAVGALNIKNSIYDQPNSNLCIYSSESIQNINIQNSLFSSNPLNLAYNNLGGNLINTNPMFVDKPNFNYHLLANSPAVNSGNNAAMNLSQDYDAINNPRIISETVDMGALEYSPTAEINEFNKETQFTVYPNPAENEVFLQFDKYQKGSLAIYDLTGKQVLSLNQIEIQENEAFRINTENFASGTYIINWKGTDYNASIKLIKK